MTEVPNPGSDPAVLAGCKCAVLDNNHGIYAPFQPDGWWITEGCPVHVWPLEDLDEDVPVPMIVG